MTTESAPRWVVVTRPDRPGLLDELAWRYRHAPWVMVVADRRRDERRRRQEPCATDLRVADRRALPAPGNQPVYRLVRQGPGFDVYEAGGHMSTWCAQCGGTVTFDLPGSDDPPAQLDVHAAHNAPPSASKSERLHSPSSGGAIGLHAEHER